MTERRTLIMINKQKIPHIIFVIYWYTEQAKEAKWYDKHAKTWEIYYKHRNNIKMQKVKLTLDKILMVHLSL